MQAAPSTDRPVPVKRSPPAREAGWRCLASGEVLPKEELIRFVVDPDNNVVPDIARNLPGPGLWVKADATAITLAARQGLFGIATKTPVKAASTLADQTMRLLRVRCLAFMGLAKGAGVAVLGETHVEMGLREKKLGLLLLAQDARSELVNLRKIPIYRLFGRDELGQAFGLATIVYAGFRPHGLTKSLKTELYRLDKLIQTSPERENG